MEKSNFILKATGVIGTPKKTVATPVFKEGGEIVSPVEAEAAKIEGKPQLKSKKDYTKGAFIGKMFQMRDITHLLHLKSASYAEHTALGGFYDGLLDFIDSIAEMYQSEELLDIRIPATVLDTTAIDYISSFKKDVKAYKDKCDWDDVVASLDEVMGLCSSTLYKLKHLK